MTYGIIFVSALAAIVAAIAVVDRQPPGEAVSIGGYSQENGGTVVNRALP